MSHFPEGEHLEYNARRRQQDIYEGQAGQYSPPKPEMKDVTPKVILIEGVAHDEGK